MWCPVGRLWPWCWLLRAAAGNGLGNRNRHPHPHAHAQSDHDSTLGRGIGLAAPLAGQRSERPQKNKAHGGPVAPAQFSTEMALNDLESIGESIVMVKNGFVR